MKCLKPLGTFLTLCITLAGVFLAGCGSGSSTGGTETGNTTGVSLRVIGYQSSSLNALELPALTVGDLEINTARIVLDRVRFRPLSDCQENEDSEGAEDIRFDGPFVVDLMNPGSVSGLEDIEIASGRYCRIEVVFKKLELEDLPQGIESDDPIVEKSIFVEGVRGDGTPFRMTTEVDEEFELENETAGFLIGGINDLSVFFIAFDFDQWFSSIDLDDSSVEVSEDELGDPLILIDDENNQEIQEEIEENIKTSADLFEDSDDDEELDPQEEDDSLATGVSAP